MSSSTIKSIMIIYFTFLIRLISSFCQTVEMGPLNASIVIDSDKYDYYVYEKIWVSIKFENYSPDTIVIPQFALESKLEVSDSKGQIYKLRLYYNPINADSIEFGGLLENDVNLLRMYGSGLVDIYGDIEVLPPETYYIRLIWNEVQFKDGQVLRYDPLVSNTLEIVIQDPQGDEKEAFDIFRDASKLRWEKERDWSTEKFLELVETYPNSVFASTALKKAILNHKFRNTLVDYKKTINLCKKLVENYPEDNYSYPSLSYIIKDYKMKKDNEGARQYLNNIESKTKSVKMKKWINEFKQKIKK